MSSQIILTLNLAEGSLLLNEGILEALGWPQQVQLLINNSTGQLLLRACTVEDAEAVVIQAESTEQFEISGRSLLKKIRQIVGWADDQPRMCYGERMPGQPAIVFNLADAVALEIVEQ